MSAKWWVPAIGEDPRHPVAFIKPEYGPAKAASDRNQGWKLTDIGLAMAQL